MRAVIVYESMYGNTHAVANSVAEGLRDEACDVTVVPVGRATEELTGHCDLLVVGGPTHMHGLPRPSTHLARNTRLPHPSRPREAGWGRGTTADQHTTRIRVLLSAPSRPSVRTAR